MAAKKKAAPKKATAKKVAAPKRSVAVKTLGSLPALTGRLRMAFRAAFTDDQCDAWGKQTEATAVVKEAEKFVSAMASALKDSTDATYSRRRLTFLCELLVLLEDEIARTSNSDSGALRATRSAVLEVANNARRDLVRRLRAVAGGQQAVLKEIAAVAPASEDSPSDVQDSLTATIDLAQKLRRNEVIETLADDVGLNEARLNSAYAALEALTGAGDVSLNTGAYEGDAPSVNRIEGRVLREMKLAQRLFQEGREAGQKLPNLVAGPSLKAIFGTNSDDGDAPAPTPPPAS